MINMNKYDERYEIRLARMSDIDDIMGFIDRYWSKGHIMSQDKKLFKYEYGHGDKLNFILAIDRNTNSIEGILGYIRSSNIEDPKKMDVWGSFWKVNDKGNNLPLLGVELAKRLPELINSRTYISIGTNPKTAIPIRKLVFNDKAAKMQHYYLLNPDIYDYKIAIINDKNQALKIGCSGMQVDLERFKSIDEVSSSFSIEAIDKIPYKDSWYFNKRYFNHPYYSYLVYGVRDKSGQIGALLVTREVEMNDAKVLRIVDYIGNHELLAGLYDNFICIMDRGNYEYIDFYSHGFNEEAILDCGFKLKDEEDLNIIPNYFEPFVQENTDIWVHYQMEETLFFKADGDQDRPNKLKK